MMSTAGRDTAMTEALLIEEQHEDIKVRILNNFYPLARLRSDSVIQETVKQEQHFTRAEIQPWR
jgi:hypothetical protein